MNPAITSLAAAAGCITSGAVAFTITQHVSPLTGIYWAVVTATTTGYGDVAPHNTSGRIIGIATMLTAVPLLANAFSHVHLHRVRKHVNARLDAHHEAIQTALGKHGIEGK